MLFLNIVGRCNQAGLERDMKILGRILTNLGHKVTYSDSARKSLYFALHKKVCYDANIFIETPEPLYFSAARRNILKPNQETMPPLEGIDVIWAKTRYAEELYKKTKIPTHYIGFTSPDRYRPAITKEPFILHTTSRSTLKGTPEVIATWQKYPDMPPLTILITPLFRHLITPLPNVTWLETFLPEEELIELQNRALYHLCPSYTEGFGHSIGEALSTGGLVITTDAPPMNELVTEESGLLCPWTNAIPMGRGEGFYCTPEQIRAAVLRAFALPDTAARCQAARAFYEGLEPALEQRLSTYFCDDCFC